jgi:RIO kinase 1
MIEKRKVEGYVFDNRTHEAIFKLSKNNIIDTINSPISSGKEAITFLGYLKDTPLALKIYKVETSNFKNMEKYINGDYRFKRVSKDKRELFLIWASKEYKNLSLSLRHGVKVPVVIAKEKNIIVMSFVGDKEGIPFPKLSEVNFTFEKVYPQILENYAKILYGAKLVHADFSAFNILINPITEEITIIDMGQAVVYSHPFSKDFLKRDIISITDFLNKKFPSKKVTYDSFLEDLKNKKQEIYGRDN